MLTRTLPSSNTPAYPITPIPAGITSSSNGNGKPERKESGSDFLADILGAKTVNSWALGCDHCQYGVRNYFNVARKVTLPMYMDKIAAWQADDTNICDCRAGRALRRWIEKQRLEEMEMQNINKEVAARRYQRLFNSTGAPEQFAGYTFKAYNERCKGDLGKQAAIKAIMAHFGNGQVDGKSGLMLWGRSDVGKTGSLVPLFSHYLSQTGRGLWIQYNELVAQLRNWQDGQVEERVRELQVAPLLFIDDLGDPLSKDGVTDYVREMLFRIFDQRNSRQITFITSNLSPGEMSKLFHERTVKRIGLLCAIIEVGGEQLGVLRQS